MSGFVRPMLTDWNRGFWDAAEDGRLVVQRCQACSELWYPPAEICPRCLEARWEWQEVSGRAEVLTYLVFHHAYNAAWKDRVPYNVVLVELEEGPRMFSNVLPLSRTDLRVGMPVKVAIDRDGGQAIPRFREAERT